jgi:hypothetical protein
MKGISSKRQMSCGNLPIDALSFRDFRSRTRLHKELRQERFNTNANLIPELSIACIAQSAHEKKTCDLAMAQVFSTFSPNLGPGSTPKTQSDSKSLSLVPHHIEFSFLEPHRYYRYSQFPIQESDRAGSREPDFSDQDLPSWIQSYTIHLIRSRYPLVNKRRYWKWP